MLEGIAQTTYGNEAPLAGRLASIGGAVSVAAAVETPFTVSSPNEFSYLVYLRADCTVIGTTAGTWALKLAVAGATALLLQMAMPASPVGSSYCWPFPVPWKTTTKATQFTLTPSVATMGTWIFICNGFYSSL